MKKPILLGALLSLTSAVYAADNQSCGPTLLHEDFGTSTNNGNPAKYRMHNDNDGGVAGVNSSAGTSSEPGSSTTYLFGGQLWPPSTAEGVNDGQYAIVAHPNHAWNDLGLGWVDSNDHTANDGEGLMMLINADEITTGVEFYRFEVNNLQPGTDIDVKFYIKNLININDPNPGTNPNLSVNLILLPSNTELTPQTTGEIPNDEQWDELTYTFTVPAGSTDTGAVLVLGNNAAGGNGNDFLLDDIYLSQQGTNCKETNNDNVTVTVGDTVNFDVLANDPDFDTGNISSLDNVTAANGGTAGGAINFDAATGELTYTPLASEAGSTVTAFYEVCSNDTPPVCVVTRVDIQVLAQPSPSYNMVKTVNPMSISAPGTLTYTFTFTNNGNVALQNLTVSDTNIDAGSLSCNGDSDSDGDIDSLAVGASETCTATRTVTQADIDNDANLVNTAVPSAEDTAGDPATEDNDGDPSTPNDDSDNTATTTISQVPGLALVKTAAVNDVNGNGFSDAGDTITYSFTVSNTGNVALTFTGVSDPMLPGLSCTLTPATLAVGATDMALTCTGNVYTLTAADVAAGQVDNSAVGSANDPNGNPVNDTSGTASSNDDRTVVMLSVAPVNAVNDTGTGIPGNPVVVSVLDNDSPNMVPGSVRIVDAGGNPVTALTVPGEGEWTVNTTTGEITFTPLPDFTGNPTPITYTVDDISGRSATAIVTVTYPRPAAPVPALGTLGFVLMSMLMAVLGRRRLRFIK